MIGKPEIMNATSFSHSDIFEAVCEAIAEVSLLPLEKVRQLEDLTGLFDSVQLVEVITIVEKSLDISIEDIEIFEISSIEAICQKVMSVIDGSNETAQAVQYAN